MYSGYTVPVEYDPILAKLITFAATRQECIQRMIRALRDYAILGVLTPIPFLVDILSCEAFMKGETYTDFIDTHFKQWEPVIKNIDMVGLAYVIDQLSNRKIKTVSTLDEAEAYSPWQTLGNFRP